MKKVIGLLLIVLACFGFASCKKEEKMNILLPSGIPAVAIGALFDDEEYNYNVVDGASMLQATLINGDYDIVIAPIILGAQLYNKSLCKYKLAAILTMGNSYLVSRQEDKLSSFKELEGETIASYGENTAPDIVLKAALKANGVDLNKVTFVYENSVSDVFSNRFMNNDKVKYILSAEPIISKMEDKAFKDNPLNKIDLQESLSSVLDIIPQAGIFVLDNEKEYSNFLNKVKDNVTYLNSNADEYANKLVNIESEHKQIFVNLTEKVISKSIPNSNITYLNSLENKDSLDKYFDMVNEYNDKILQGSKVNEDFYYEK